MTMKFEEKPEGNGSLVAKSQPFLGKKHQANGKPVANGKAEVSERQEANGKYDVPRKSLKTYSWQEIQRHNQETDQWLVINRKVYDVTGWADRHPGGRRVLTHYAGEDATDAFRAMHLDLDIVRVYLKPLLIGELIPGEPNQERNKNPQLVEDFQELRRTLEAMNMFDANLGFFFLHLAQILILEVLAWAMVWHFGSGWLITIFISCLLTVSQAQSSFLQHDTGHLSIFKKSKWNHLMHKFVMCHLKGLSTNWWNYRHFQHHVKPNIYPKDPDIDMGPLFVLGDSQPIKYGKKKIKYIDYEKQHLYFYMIGLPLLMPVYFNLQSMQVMYLRRYWEDIAWVSSFYIRYFITFGRFYGIFGTMVLIYLVKFLESPWIAYVTQMSHIPMKMSGEENKDWLSTQSVPHDAAPQLSPGGASGPVAVCQARTAVREQAHAEGVWRYRQGLEEIRSPLGGSLLHTTRDMTRTCLCQRENHRPKRCHLC
ncbi:fatty acid desaturase 2-like protein FADS2B isoform X2 [Hippopotamus amphibius kiboko]|uniref:fatty acid desaturase 2-like protein FADS2B isoform X2 n=1 Tax=Hippopotamus amphibius kiboko TaxID=575201 RepID=UPI002595829B|nr:fatty acid desaturase 2-like protein FADS2B isoform X2 [Hippopotamus amphibius kiboko]